MIELVIFDCDGVLVDSEIVAAQIMSEALGEAGLSMTPQQCLAAFVGLDAPATRRKLQTVYDTTLSADFDRLVVERLDAAFRTKLKALPGVAELIGGLRQPYCVASNSSHDRLRRTFAATGLAPLVDGRIFSADDVARGKPAPDLFLHAARVMGDVAPANCLVVEDSVTGVTAARAAGMRVIGYCGGNHILPGHAEQLLSLGVDHILTDHRELAVLPLLAGDIAVSAGV